MEMAAAGSIFRAGEHQQHCTRALSDPLTFGLVATNSTNTIAAIGKWSKPGGWADPDLLIGPETKKPMHIGGQTDEQARTQLNLWAVFPAPLLISQNMLTCKVTCMHACPNRIRAVLTSVFEQLSVTVLTC